MTARVGLALLLATTCGLAGAAPASAQHDSSLTDAFVELRILRGPQAIVDVLVRDSTILVSLRQFLRLAEVRSTERVAEGQVISIMEPEGRRITFDTDANRIARGDSTFTLAPSDAVWHDKALYVSTHMLALAYGITVTVDWDDLLIMVRRSAHLPVARRLERVRRRAMLLSAQAATRPALMLPVRRSTAEGVVLDWAATSSTRDPVGASSIDLGLGTQVVGGSLDLRHRWHNASGTRFTTTDASWSKAWSRSSWLRQLRLGDAPGTGPAPRWIRGASITNAPFLRGSEFAREWFDGTLPDGWELELYRSGQLIGVANPDAAQRYSLPVPVRYGLNPVQLVAYGPTGEVRRFRRNFVVPSTRLPPGEFEYAVGAGACRADPCQATFNVDMRYGLNRRITLQAGSDFFWRDSLPDLWHPYALISAAATGSLGFTMEAVANTSVGAQIEYAPTSDFELSLEHVEFASGPDVPIVGSAALRRRTQGFLFWRPGKQDRSPFLRLMASRFDAENRHSAMVRFSSIARVGGTHLELGATRTFQRLNGLSQTNSTVLDVAATGVLLAPARFRSTFLRGRLAVNLDSGLTRATALVARPITPDLRVELETSWQRGPRGFAIDLTIVTSLPTVRAVSHNTYSALDGIRGNQRLEGSLMWSRRHGRLAFADGRSLGRAGIAGEVFFDVDGNGRRDADEVGVPNVRIRVGPKGERTDSLGQFTTWDLVPFEAVRLEIDTLSIDNPLWVPATPVMSAVPSPNTFNVVQIPLVRAGELSGRVILDGTDRAVGGVQIVLHDLSAEAPRRVMSFSDGAFFFYGIPPGRYELRLTAAQLDQLGATAESIPVVVDPAGGSAAIENIVLRVKRERRTETDRDRPDRVQDEAGLRALEERRRLAAERHETEEVRRLIARVVRFAYDATTFMTPADRRVLEEKRAILLANPDLRIQITGHCDERGTREYNLALGMRRARAARRFLLARGIGESRIMVRSRGEEDPIDPGHTVRSWSENRRVEFEIVAGGSRLRRPVE